MSLASVRIAGVVLLGVLVAASATAAEPQAVSATPGRKVKLDLKPPDIRRLFPSTQLQEWANPAQPEYIEEVEVHRRRPTMLRKVASWFLPYTSPEVTNTRIYRVVDSTQSYLKPVVALPRMAGEPLPYDR